MQNDLQQALRQKWGWRKGRACLLIYCCSFKCYSCSHFSVLNFHKNCLRALASHARSVSNTYTINRGSIVIPPSVNFTPLRHSTNQWQKGYTLEWTSHCYVGKYRGSNFLEGRGWKDRGKVCGSPRVLNESVLGQD